MFATTAGTWLLAIAALGQDNLPEMPGNPVVEELLVLHNRERELKRLPALTLSDKLCESAQAHARDMAFHEKMTHTGSDSSTPGQRAKRTGYVGSIGENVAAGANSPEHVVFLWMNSPGHRANILGKHVEMGAAVAMSESGRPYWCVVFGRPRSSSSPVARALDRADLADRVNDEAAAALIREINLIRKSAGQAPIKANRELSRAARDVSVALAAENSVDLDGAPEKLINPKAKERREIRVKVGADIPTPKEAARQFAGEKSNDLASFQEIGVGYTLAKGRTPYWCVVFAKGAPAPAQKAAVAKKKR
jgi:uncharacterized protein YkwD